MGKRQIEHHGIVKRVMPLGISVVVVQETVCAACTAARLCHSSEKNEKQMDIFCSNASSYKVGQEVVIVGEMTLGLRATLWAYVFPLILLLTTLIVFDRLTGSEAWGAMISLISLVLYFSLLYLFRHRLQRNFQFRIKS